MRKLEIFHGKIDKCTNCGMTVVNEKQILAHFEQCGTSEILHQSGFFYYFYDENGLPSDEIAGPFDTEEGALDDATTEGDDDTPEFNDDGDDEETPHLRVV